MKNSSLTWIFVLGVIVVIFISFNHQNAQDSVPLSEIFPDDHPAQDNIEFEIVEKEADGVTPSVAKTPAASSAQSKSKIPAPAPAVETTANMNSTSSGLEGTAFTIQVLSSKDKTATEKKLQQIKAKGFDAFMLLKDLGDKGLWYRIYVGRFNVKSEAEAILNQLQIDYKNSFIIAPNKKN